MPSGGTADGVGNTRFARLAGEGIVRPLAGCDADRVDRREVDDVEAHRLGVLHPTEAVAEGGAATGLPLGGAWEELIPGGEGRTLPVDAHFLGRAVGGRERAVGPLTHEGDQLRIGGRGDQGGGIGRCLEAVGMRRELLCGGVLAGTSGGGTHESGTLQGLRGKGCGATPGLFADLLDPGTEGIPPRLDGPLGEADGTGGKASPPAILSDGGHRGLLPFLRARGAPLHQGKDDIVPLLEDIGIDGDFLTGSALDRIFSTLDLRPEILDDDGLEHEGKAVAV